MVISTGPWKGRRGRDRHGTSPATWKSPLRCSTAVQERSSTNDLLSHSSTTPPLAPNHRCASAFNPAVQDRRPLLHQRLFGPAPGTHGCPETIVKHLKPSRKLSFHQHPRPHVADALRASGAVARPSRSHAGKNGLVTGTVTPRSAVQPSVRSSRFPTAGIKTAAETNSRTPRRDVPTGAPLVSGFS